MKKFTAILIGVLVVAGLYYLISPVWRVVERNDPDPTATTSLMTPKTVAMMEPDERIEYEKAMKAMASVVKEMQESMPTEAQAQLSGGFVSSAHEVSGAGKVVLAGNTRVLRFENFSTLNGPDLRIYLSADLAATDFVDLGPIKATKGNINYEIPSTVDLTKYNKILVWCRQFSVLFGYAELK